MGSRHSDAPLRRLRIPAFCPVRARPAKSRSRSIGRMGLRNGNFLVTWARCDTDRPRGGALGLRCRGQTPSSDRGGFGAPRRHRYDRGVSSRPQSEKPDSRGPARRMNLAQRVGLALGLVVLLAAAGAALLPFGARCGAPAVAVFERAPGVAADSGLKWDDESRRWVRSTPRPGDPRAVVEPTMCARDAGRRLQTAGTIGLLGAIGTAGAYRLLRDPPPKAPSNGGLTDSA
jgi:hypothetical protein